MSVWIECGWRHILSVPSESEDARYEESATKQVRECLNTLARLIESVYEVTSKESNEWTVSVRERWDAIC